MKPALLTALLLIPWPLTAGQLQVTMYEGNYASVNAFIFTNGQTQVVMDVLRKSDEAELLADVVAANGLPLTHVLVSHGHTDHFTGLHVFKRRFPEAKIVVASEPIKQDIKAYAAYMDGLGALDPNMKLKSAANPGGFDYDAAIQVLAEPAIRMAGGGLLELTTDYLPNEADHIATVYAPELNALFLSDLAYNNVHLWIGDDISRQDVANWRAELLRIRAEYTDRDPTVYPGHGKVTDLSVVPKIVAYIDDFLQVTEAAESAEAASARMQMLYPGWKQADFFLKYSVLNHVK